MLSRLNINSLDGKRSYHTQKNPDDADDRIMILTVLEL